MDVTKDVLEILKWRLRFMVSLRATPPQKSPAQQKQTFAYFEDIVRHMKTFPNIRFITGSQTLELYPDLAQGREFSATELAEIAKAMTSRVSFQQQGEYALSAGEILDLLTSYVATATLKDRPAASVRLSQTPYGPTSAPPALEKPINVPSPQFLSTVLDVRDFLMINHQVPDVV